MTTTDAVSKYKHDEKLCVLNFASYKKPGGGFINGAIAQEESICHDSTLFNVISSEKFESYYEDNKIILMVDYIEMPQFIHQVLYLVIVKQLLML